MVHLHSLLSVQSAQLHFTLLKVLVPDAPTQAVNFFNSAFMQCHLHTTQMTKTSEPKEYIRRLDNGKNKRSWCTFIQK